MLLALKQKIIGKEDVSIGSLLYEAIQSETDMGLIIPPLMKALDNKDIDALKCVQYLMDKGQLRQLEGLIEDQMYKYLPNIQAVNIFLNMAYVDIEKFMDYCNEPEAALQIYRKGQLERLLALPKFILLATQDVKNASSQKLLQEVAADYPELFQKYEDQVIISLFEQGLVQDQVFDIVSKQKLTEVQVLKDLQARFHLNG